MEIINRTFAEWKIYDLKQYIGLSLQEDLSYLTEWLTIPVEITKREMSELKELCEEAKFAIGYWNEMELRERFIAPLTRLVKFHNYKKNINFFAERKLSKTITNILGQITLHGTVDWFLATGIQDPKQPFFFIHEYKREKGTDNDPVGQLLAAMVVAQELNQDAPQPSLFSPNPTHFYRDIPIYGAYIIGRFWFFVVLKDKDYSISSSFDCTKEQDLQAIFKILKAQKQIIYSYLEEK